MASDEMCGFAGDTGRERGMCVVVGGKRDDRIELYDEAEGEAEEEGAPLVVSSDIFATMYIC